MTAVFRDAQPNKEEVQQLRSISCLPPARPLSILQKTQMSKFRHYMAGQSNTIIPFIKSVEWANSQVRSVFFSKQVIREVNRHAEHRWLSDSVLCDCDACTCTRPVEGLDSEHKAAGLLI